MLDEISKQQCLCHHFIRTSLLSFLRYSKFWCYYVTFGLIWPPTTTHCFVLSLLVFHFYLSVNINNIHTIVPLIYNFFGVGFSANRNTTSYLPST